MSRDADGHAIGGLRLPLIDVPAAIYNGEACIQAGTTTPLPAARLAQMYTDQEAYVKKLATATDRSVADGYLLCRDAETIMRLGSASTVGGADKAAAAPACAEPS